MKMVVLSAAAVLSIGLAQAVLADVAAEYRARFQGIEGIPFNAYELKMLGVWEGAPCDGRFIFRSDGTYELTHFGPGGDESQGSWKVQMDARPATVVLNCKSSEIPADELAKMKLIKLDHKNLTVERANKGVGHYTRVKK